ncbi:DUF547 domain-containing protein [Qipengyuania sp. RANM35]|uniref:DUF547 domain-containing protein n=1 Tax=Qipengyuania sp. RANM35 TaxID=3068635 RepID=UPI0034DB6C31
MTIRSIAFLGAATALALSAPLQAETPNAPSSEATRDQAFDRFVPQPSGKETKVDYSFLDDALKYMVLRMGPSTRQGMGKPSAGMGTRMTYGHDSRVRLEGNRIVFEYLDEDAITPLTAYREDLERLGAELEIATLPRNEQLSYWINLHNVAVIEQIARNYPVQYPSRMKLGADGTGLDDSPVVTVAGVAMSPKDIRTKIVFPNWRDANVIYGFFRGEVGGPSIQPRAFTSDNVGDLLTFSGQEFVNSLRGVEAFGDDLLVSRIYEEAAPFYFPQMGADLKAHLATHAAEDVAKLVAAKPNVKVNQYEGIVADLAAGDREPTYSYIETDGEAQRTRITPSIARLLSERYDKFEKLRREGQLTGRVIIIPQNGGPAVSSDEADPEVK